MAKLWHQQAQTGPCVSGTSARVRNYSTGIVSQFVPFGFPQMAKFSGQEAVITPSAYGNLLRGKRRPCSRGTGVESNQLPLRRMESNLLPEATIQLYDYGICLRERCSINSKGK